jgi:small subunit ribosomal protein S6
MKNYELVAVLHPDLEIDVDTPIAKIEKLVANLGGKVIKRDNWGKKRLAYKVKGQNFGVYIEFEVSIDPTQVRDLDRSLGLTEEVIRHLLVTREVQKPRLKKAGKEKAGKDSDDAESGGKVEAKAKSSDKENKEEGDG